MNSIRIGLAKKKGVFSILESPDVFIEVPVDRSICVSYYLLHISKKRTHFRRSDRFYEDYRVTFERSVCVSMLQERDIVCWGKSSYESHGMDTIGPQILGDILNIPSIKETYFLDTSTPKKLKKILDLLGRLGEEETK